MLQRRLETTRDLDRMASRWAQFSGLGFIRFRVWGFRV